jgi:putative nucleotidyltransferase with HDIG domain
MGFLKKIKRNKVYKFFENNTKYRRALYVTFFTLMVVALISGSMIPNVLDLAEGDVSPVTIEADRYLTFIDEEATEIKKAEIAAKVKTVYRLEPTVVDEYEAQLENITDKIKQILNDKELLLNQKVNILSGLGFNFTLIDVETLSAASESQIDALVGRLEVIIKNNFVAGVNSETLIFTIEKINSDISLLDINPVYKKFISNLANTLKMVPNLIPDEEATAKEVAAELQKVDPVRIVVQKNERVVSKGEVLTSRQIEIINWLGYSDKGNIPGILLGIVLYTLLFIMLISLFLKNYKPEMYRKDKNILLLMVLFYTALILIRVFITIQNYSTSTFAPLVSFLIPTAAVAMMIAILLDDKLAYVSAAIISIYIGLITEDMAYVYTSFIGSYVGIYLVAKINQRGDLIKAGVFISLANCISIAAWLLTVNEDYSFYLTALAFGAINGFLSTVLTIGILPYLEDLFNKTTIIKLLELFNPNHPLLKKLIIEAPGTYHHSIILGNLAEGAAEAIGANSVLVRVGAAYHDIGKLKRPFFYVENQVGENPHEKLNPSLSVIVLQAHVKEGIELGKKYKLPQKILDFIPMHHGTSLMNFFFHKAKEANPDVSGDDFRYEGPKPNTKETAILMLADSVEAAVKSIKDINPIKIDTMVRNIVKDKLYDGQLDESELTMKEIEAIIKTFVKILQGIYHTRIEYPEGVLKEMKKESQDGNSNDKDKQ